MDLARWLRPEQRLEGTIVLEHGEPRPDALEIAMENAGYRRAPEPPSTDVTGTGVGYREASLAPLSMRFVARGRRNAAVRSIHVFRIDARTLGYSIVCAPLWLLQLSGVVTATFSVVEAALGDPAHHPWVVGLIAAGILLGLPKLWVDDARQGLRDAVEGAVGAAPASQGEARGPKGSPMPHRVMPEMEEEPHWAERVRVATDDPALSAAARASRDAVARPEPTEPEDEVEALERAARRGKRDD